MAQPTADFNRKKMFTFAYFVINKSVLRPNVNICIKSQHPHDLTPCMSFSVVRNEYCVDRWLAKISLSIRRENWLQRKVFATATNGKCRSKISPGETEASSFKNLSGTFIRIHIMATQGQSWVLSSPWYPRLYGPMTSERSEKWWFPHYYWPGSDRWSNTHGSEQQARFNFT